LLSGCASDPEAAALAPGGEDSLAAIELVPLAQADQGLGSGALFAATERSGCGDRELGVRDRQAAFDDQPGSPPRCGVIEGGRLEFEQREADLERVLEGDRAWELGGGSADDACAAWGFERASKRA
jgi:hypothetical protein